MLTLWQAKAVASHLSRYFCATSPSERPKEDADDADIVADRSLPAVAEVRLKAEGETGRILPEVNTTQLSHAVAAHFLRNPDAPCDESSRLWDSVSGFTILVFAAVSSQRLCAG